MIAEVYWIDGIPKGRLGISARPRGGDWLEDEAKAWQTAGVVTIVSLLTPEEVNELGLEDEERLCRRLGIVFRSLAIPDRGVPATMDSMKRLAAAVLRDLEAGKSVVAHCRQGIGRSSLAAASALILMGEDPDQALRRIEAARGCSVPDTPEQQMWLRRFAQAHARRAA